MSAPMTDAPTPGADAVKPMRVQRLRKKGAKLPPNTVSVTRPGPFGNPFDFRKSEYCWIALSYGCRADPRGRQEASVRAFREWIDPGYGRRMVRMEMQPGFGGRGTMIPAGPKVEAGEAPSLKEVISKLRGKNLACFCKLGDPCHADALLEIANRPICEGVEPTP